MPSPGDIIQAAPFDVLFGAPTPYNPIWSTTGTPPAIGNGALTGGYTRLGQNGLTFFRITLVAGSTTTFGTGAWSFTLPTNVAQPTFMDYNWVGTVIDAGTGSHVVFASFSGPNKISPATGLTFSSITNTSPMTWATNDRLFIPGWYWAA